MRWCFDTSALIEPWVRRYPPDVFSPVWKHLVGLIDTGEIIAPTDVLNELSKQKDDLYDWTKANISKLFKSPDRAVMEAYTEIVNDHVGFMKINSTKSGADPFVVAMAEVHGIVVVTYETMAKEGTAPKIPNVCAARRLPPCVDLVDVLRATGFKM